MTAHVVRSNGPRWCHAINSELRVPLGGRCRYRRGDERDEDRCDER